MNNQQQQSARLSLFSLLFFGLLLAVSAQEIRENENGEKIIVYPDGRVEYFNKPAGDGDINTQTSDLPATFPVFTGYIEPLEGALSVNQEDLYLIALRKSQIAEEAADVANIRAEQAAQNLQQLQNLSPDQRGPNYSQQIQIAQQVREQTLVEAREANNLSNEAVELTEKGGFVEEFNARRQKDLASENRSNQISETAGQSYSQLIPLMENYVADQRENLLENPPENTCQYTFQGEDVESGRYRRDIDKQFLFNYTDERLRPFLKDKEYLSCHGYLTSLGGYRFLTLEFTFAYPNAREAYGFIDRNSVLTVKLLNGDYVNLRADQMDKGSYDTVKEELTYQILYPIDRGQISGLKGSEVDFIRVFWSTGFEEYQVYQLDFFQRQFECLGD